MTVALILVASFATGCIHASQPSTERQRADVAALAGVLPLLDRLAVREWRDQDWCRDFEYRVGHFITSDELDNCNPMGDATAPFNDAATGDFGAIRSAMNATGVSIVEVYRSTVTPHQIVFDLRAGMYDRFSYVFEPGFAPPENIENEWVATPIDRNWYFVWEDWN